jgi:hypothetical protein
MVNAMQAIEQTHREDGRIVVRTLPNGVTTEWNFDWDGYLTSLVSKRNGTSFDTHSYTRDRESNITQEVVNGTTNSFGYDNLYRLTSSMVSGTESAIVRTFGMVVPRSFSMA